ncbi:MAG TPA: flagellar motor switch protein FliN [Balneolaceae bacterium]|nr:flagellar motor switch protein FliN [Balneolaceae bacterium]
MNLEQWKYALDIQLAGLQQILKNVTEHDYVIEIEDAKFDNTEEAEQQIKKAGIIVRFVEKEFQSEISLGFTDDWGDFLATHLLDKPSEAERRGKDLVAQLGNDFMKMIASSLAESDIEVDVVKTDEIFDGQVKDRFNHQEYYLAHLNATLEKEEDAIEEKFSSLGLKVAISNPDENKFAECEEKIDQNNPLIDGRYSKFMKRYAYQIEWTKKDNLNDFGSSISMQGQKVEFEDFGQSDSVNNHREIRNIDMLKNIEMNVSVELGRRKMPLGKILKLTKGSIIELEKLAGEPVEILVNGRKIAQGDVVVVDEHFGVRISNLLASQKHIRELQ